MQGAQPFSPGEQCITLPGLAMQIVAILQRDKCIGFGIQPIDLGQERFEGFDAGQLLVPNRLRQGYGVKINDVGRWCSSHGGKDKLQIDLQQ